MHKVLRLIYIIIIIILLLTIKKTSLNNKISNDTTSKVDTPKTSEVEYGDNILETYDGEVFEDTDKDGAFDSYGDQTYDLSEAKDKFGISFNLEIYDTNGNSMLDVGETTHAKLTINNDSEKNYVIQDLRIDAKSEFFDSSAFSNITTTNFEDNQFSFDNNQLKYSNSSGVVLEPGKNLEFEWDITWTDDEAEVAKKHLADNAAPYDFINIEFITYTGDEDALYYTIGNQTFK